MVKSHKRDFESIDITNFDKWFSSVSKIWSVTFSIQILETVFLLVHFGERTFYVNIF